MSMTATSERRVPPIKLLGARRALASLAIGACLGVGAGALTSLIFLPAAATASRRTGLLVMTLLFGLFFGPMLTLSAASMLAVKGLSTADLRAAGRRRLLLVAAAGGAVGIVAGFIVGAVLGPSDAVTFMAAQLGGTLGALIAGSWTVSREIGRRLGA
jgi:hypothetical protein